MAYLVNSTRKAKVSVAGQDYTDYLVSWQVSDNTYVESGMVTTAGQLVLGDKPNRDLLQNYRRKAFKRGDIVICQVEKDDGTYVTHPRGYLYVSGVEYNSEANQLTADIVCELSMAILVDSKDTKYFGLAPIPVSDDRRDMPNLAASVQAGSRFLWQDNKGRIRRTYAVTAERGTVPAGKFTSVLGYTAESVTPLAGAEPVPERIKLGWQIPKLPELDPEKDPLDGKVLETITNSLYETDYPTIIFEREDPDANTIDGTVDFPDLDDIDDLIPDDYLPPPVSVCGNEIPLPEIILPELDIDIEPGDITLYSAGGGGLATCNNNYRTKTTSHIMSGRRKETTKNFYDGPGTQLSSSESTIESPLFEQNRQYFADKFAYCRSLHATVCNPNGGCPYTGSDQETTSKREVENYFDENGTVIKKVTNSYNTFLSAAKPDDWRSGNENGIPQDFQDDFHTQYKDLFNSQRVIDEWTFEDDQTTQVTTTYTSVASARGVGLSVGRAKLDCMQGIKTSTVRRSRGTNLNPPIQDTLGNTEAQDANSVIRFEVNLYPEGVNGGVFELKNERVQVSHPKGCVYQFKTDSEGRPKDDEAARLVSGGSGYTKNEVLRLTRASDTDEGFIELTVSEVGSGNSSFTYKDKSATITLFANMQNRVGTGYIDVYEVDRSLPTQINSRETVFENGIIDRYKEYLRKLLIGESMGLQIAESLRDEVLDDEYSSEFGEDINVWVPNFPFRFYDNVDECMLAMQMDATSWGVSGTAAVMVTNGIYLAKTDALVELPDNIDNSATELGFPVKPNPAAQVRREGRWDDLFISGSENESSNLQPGTYGTRLSGPTELQVSRVDSTGTDRSAFLNALPVSNGSFWVEATVSGVRSTFEVTYTSKFSYGAPNGLDTAGYGFVGGAWTNLGEGGVVFYASNPDLPAPPNEGAVAPNPPGGAVRRVEVGESGSGFSSPGTYEITVDPAGASS